MIVTGRHLPRRTFLKGLGAAVALPMLDAMTPAFAKPVTAGTGPTRLSFVYVPNGVTLNQWTPSGAGRTFEFSRILKPIEPFRDLRRKEGWLLSKRRRILL